MRMAILADIHANLPALRAVLEDLPSVDLIACAGDVVEYYAEPDEVCDLLREHGVLTVRGNHDAYVIGELQPSEVHAAAYRTTWTRRTLSQRNLAWLRSLPIELIFHWEGRSVCVRHASPWDLLTYLYPDSHELGRITLQADHTLVVGHTHRPMLVHCGQGVLLNPGSVGQPRDGDPRPSYAILDTGSGQVEFRRASYDVVRYQQHLAERGYDKRVVSILGRRGP